MLQAAEGLRALFHDASVFSAITVVIASSLSVAPAGFAQLSLASISGVITDAQSSVVPEARATAINSATGVQTTVTSNMAGFYSIQSLAIGRNNLTVGHPGFHNYVREGITLTTGQELDLDILEVGHAARRSP